MFHSYKTVLKRHTKPIEWLGTMDGVVGDCRWGGWGPFEDCVCIYIILQVSYLFFYHEDISNFIYFLINHLHFTDGEAISES